jgi:hypothetical protein
MKPEKDLHLKEEHLITALVDANDLAPALREHLARCPVCRIEKERVENSLERLGREAARLSPAPRKKILLPLEQPEKTSWLSWQMKTTVGMACLCVLILFGVVSNHFSTVQEPGIKTISEQVKSIQDPEGKTIARQVKAIQAPGKKTIAQQVRTVQEPGEKSVAQGGSKATALMTEVSTLSENALPSEYMVMTGEMDELDEEEEGEEREEEEFMDFMMTLDQEDHSNNHS